MLAKCRNVGTCRSVRTCRNVSEIKRLTKSEIRVVYTRDAEAEAEANKKQSLPHPWYTLPLTYSYTRIRKMKKIANNCAIKGISRLFVVIRIYDENISSSWWPFGLDYGLSHCYLIHLICVCTFGIIADQTIARIEKKVRPKHFLLIIILNLVGLCNMLRACVYMIFVYCNITCRPVYYYKGSDLYAFIMKKYAI